MAAFEYDTCAAAVSGATRARMARARVLMGLSFGCSNHSDRRAPRKVDASIGSFPAMDTATPSPKSAYQELARLQLRLHRYNHLGSIVSWDRNAMMPPKGNEARAAAEAELDALVHRLRTDPQQVTWLDAAEREPLDELERANLREIRRQWRQANALPESLVEAKTLACARCERAWRSQRPANDWPGFLANLRDVGRLAREEAELLSQSLGPSRY